jgi:hypothetical protein
MTSTEEKPVATAEAVPEVPEVVENEKDQPAKKGKAFGDVVCINAADSTINCLIDVESGILSHADVDQLGTLLAQARGNAGVKKGRYYYEVQILSQTASKFEFNIGVSTAKAQWVAGEDSIAFDNFSNCRTNEEVLVKKGKMIKKSDVIGILLNMDAKMANKMTISLFINGERRSDPIPLPDKLQKESLFPHISFKGCVLGVNFGAQLVNLPFTVSMWGSLAATEGEASKTSKLSNPQVIVPIGKECTNEVDAIVKKCDGHFLKMDTEFLDQWAKVSGVHKKNESHFGIKCFDSPTEMLPWIRAKSQSVVWGLGNNLFSVERQKVLKGLPDHKKIAVVGDVAGNSDRVFRLYDSAALPTEEEFEVIKCNDLQKAQTDLDSWKNDQRLRSRVENFAAGEGYKTTINNMATFVAEKKKAEETKFTDEDWMLFNARVEFSTMIHNFKLDISDETRPSFPPALLPHYYKVYAQKGFAPSAYACVSVEEFIKEHLADSISFGPNNLLESKLEADIEFQKVFDMVEEERDCRETRIGAGDELSELKFSARGGMSRPKGHGKGQGKGPIVHSGIKRPGMQPIQNYRPAQRIRTN